jgi:hypothetical protein
MYDKQRSPLWLLAREPALNDFINYLRRGVEPVRAGEPHTFAFSRRSLREVHKAFDQMLLKGEERLHRLAELLCTAYLPSYQVQSVVIGEISAPDAARESFVLTRDISTQDLYSTLDIDLGTRQLSKLRFYDEGKWLSASLVANFVEYQPLEPSRFNIQKLTSRVKAEEEIWNKVVDEIFDLDALVRRDKKMSHLSYFIKDVLGIKIIVGGHEDVLPMHDALLSLTSTPPLQLVETKNYLGKEERKVTGWEALKSVFLWGDKTFEIQIQPLRNYLREREYLTKESHAAFKSKRDSVRNQIAVELPAFSFYRDLLRWVFKANAVGAPPTHAGVTITVED